MKKRLNAEEREILEHFERGDLTPVSDAQREMETARHAARNTFNKTRRVNLAGHRARLQPCPRACARGGNPVPDAVVERHSQVPFRAVDREPVTSVISQDRQQEAGSASSPALWPAVPPA